MLQTKFNFIIIIIIVIIIIFKWFAIKYELTKRKFK